MPDTPNPARPVFPQQARAQVAAADPETLFDELPRRRDGVGVAETTRFLYERAVTEAD